MIDARCLYIHTFIVISYYHAINTIIVVMLLLLLSRLVLLLCILGGGVVVGHQAGTNHHTKHHSESTAGASESGGAFTALLPNRKKSGEMLGTQSRSRHALRCGAIAWCCDSAGDLGSVSRCQPQDLAWTHGPSLQASSSL